MINPYDPSSLFLALSYANTGKSNGVTKEEMTELLKGSSHSTVSNNEVNLQPILDEIRSIMTTVQTGVTKIEAIGETLASNAKIDELLTAIPLIPTSTVNNNLNIEEKIQNLTAKIDDIPQVTDPNRLKNLEVVQGTYLRERTEIDEITIELLQKVDTILTSTQQPVNNTGIIDNT